MKKKNIAVIGGCGFIGSHLTNELARANNVLVLDNLITGKKEYISPHAEFQRFDIRYSVIRLYKIFKDFKIDYVFHLAAEPFIPKSYEHPEEFFDVNVKGTLNVLKASQEAEVKRILYMSSSEVYGTGTQKFMNEQHPTLPASTYAVSKLTADRVCFTSYKEHKIPCIIVRLFNNYGGNWTQPYIIPEIIQQLRNSSILKLGNIKAQRDFLYVEDGTKMIAELMEKGKIGETYNLGSGKTYSIEYIAKLLGTLIYPRKKIEIRLDTKKLRPLDVEYLRSDNSKIYKVIKCRPGTSIKEGLIKTIKWFEENRDV
ncbi:GDP-mannose 4,6-dehydratase [Patescibacteria group bacterium]|nr:GDP-mannose 4,6-dehydratase [Patescibacteria group bacterium]